MDKKTLLKDRALMLHQARDFFFQRGVTETDCPMITSGASVDAHIDLIPITYASKEIRYLHSSPEYGMKRLLALNIGDIYQLSHVFRDGECSPKHNPEFMMAEWYRLGVSFDEIINETLDFIRLFLGPLPSSTLSYRTLFKTYTGFDYLEKTEEELLGFLQEKGIQPYPDIITEGRDALLNMILGSLIEPRLGENELLVLNYYPSSQAALAQTKVIEGEQVAERFEVYYKGLELANGYHELANAQEQRARLINANEQRIALNKQPLPIDEQFLKALEEGVPDSCGVAVGFDRLMMLRHQTNHINDVIPFGWDQA